MSKETRALAFLAIVPPAIIAFVVYASAVQIAETLWPASPITRPDIKTGAV